MEMQAALYDFSLQALYTYFYILGSVFIGIWFYLLTDYFIFILLYLFSYFIFYFFNVSMSFLNMTFLLLLSGHVGCCVGVNVTYVMQLHVPKTNFP